jgi:hypothetical protein
MTIAFCTRQPLGSTVQTGSCLKLSRCNTHVCRTTGILHIEIAYEIYGHPQWFLDTHLPQCILYWSVGILFN